jgi:hypothetical protein
MISYENRAVGRFQWLRYLIFDCAELLQQRDGGYQYYSTDMCMHLLCVGRYSPYYKPNPRPSSPIKRFAKPENGKSLVAMTCSCIKRGTVSFSGECSLPAQHG